MVIPNLVIDAKLKTSFERRDKRRLCSLTYCHEIRGTIFWQVSLLALVHKRGGHYVDCQNDFRYRKARSGFPSDQLVEKPLRPSHDQATGMSVGKAIGMRRRARRVHLLFGVGQSGEHRQISK